MSDDWESSFSSILDRTKENLNRINNRFAPQPQTNNERAVLSNNFTQAPSSPIKGLFSSLFVLIAECGKREQKP